MPLSNTITFAPRNGTAASMHGWSGTLNPVAPVVESWARPGATGNGFQTIGAASDDSSLTVWAGLSSELECFNRRRDLAALIGKVSTLTRTSCTSVYVVVTGLRVSTCRRTKGSAAWRLECELTMKLVEA